MPDETIRDLIDRALDAYAVLEELGEQIEDEWSYVADLSDAWRTRLDAVAAHRGAEDAIRRGERRDRPAPSTRSAGSRTPIARSTGCRPSRRSSCSPWASGREVPGRRQGRPGRRLRRDPGRSAGRARRRPCWPTPRPPSGVLARAVMNGETTDAGRLAGDVPDPVRPGRDRRRRRARPAPRPSWPRRSRSPTAGEQVRSQVRGALVEELTARAPAPDGSTRPPSAASAASCSTASAPRSTRTT